MKNLSFWAIMNPWKSQSILVVCHLLLTILAIYGGVLLFAHDVFVPKAFLYLGEILFFGLLVCYPIRRARHKFWKTSFVKQKLMDAGFVLSYVLMAVSLSNSDAQFYAKQDAETAFSAPIVLRENVKPMNSNIEKTSLLSRKGLQKQFKTFVADMKAQELTDAQIRSKIAGTLFLMVLFMGLIALLACGLACSNSNAAAVLVWIGGWALVLAIGVSAIRKLKGQRAKNYQPMPTQ